jgi:Carboxypeptidase regulatory-like domain/TonB dependent receptor
MRVKKGVVRAIVAVCVAAIASVAYAQATSTFNGRVVDQADAVLPGVTVTVTNNATGVVRTTVTNAEGQYFLPGLEPGTYQVKTELAGFAESLRENVRLNVEATITIDFKLALAGLNETLTVTGEAPLIQATQSKVANTIETTELQNLPMITRTISGMLELLPGASPVAALHRTKESVGSVSYAGSSGGNVIPTVDGADNRDNHYSGPLMSFTTESLEQFQLASNQFSAADGRSSGAAISLVTKSGTNQLHGTVFGYERDRKLTSRDYFTEQANGTKTPFSRQQFGASGGGPIVRNKMFFFGAIEQQQQHQGIFIPQDLYAQLDALVPFLAAGKLPPGSINPNHPRELNLPGHLRMFTAKANAQLNNKQSLMVRYAGQYEARDAVTWPGGNNNDNGQPDNMTIKAFSAVAQHSYVLGNAGLNQITGQMNQMDYLADVVDAVTGKHYTRDFPSIDILGPRLSFPAVTTGAGGDAGTQSLRRVYQIRDDVSLLAGDHSLKFGANYNFLWHLGILNGNEMFATLTFFDDPLTIINNTNGRYPQGFQTPGILRTWQQANGGAMNGQGYWADTITNAQQFGTWLQDDWRITPKLTLNLGLRYDVDINLMDEDEFELNATRQVLAKIGDPNGSFPKTPKKNVSPRVGFAYDLSGTGSRVLRGGAGVYFDQYNTAASAGDITSQNKRPLNALATLNNSQIGQGELPNFRLMIDPLPPAPTEGNKLPLNSQGQWINPDIVEPRTYQAHVGYAHTLAANTTLSVDYTYSEGRNELRPLNVNPILDGQRRLAPALVANGYAANQFSSVMILSSVNKSRYNALTFLFQRRLPRATLQAHYTFAHAYAYGGSTGNRSGSSQPMVWNQPFGPGEWGPTGADERHRMVATGVFDLVYGIQLSPVVQLASARPYNLLAGTDLNRDGNSSATSGGDRYVDPATGQQVSLNSARGDNTFVFDMRTTKFFNLGNSDRKIGAFVEFFNLFNTANFGAQYTGSGRSSSFRQPNGYIPGIGYPRQVQLGARFQF